MADLLDCPFCNGEASLEAEFENTGQNRSRMTIECFSCGAQMSSVKANASLKALREGQRERLVSSWNRRDGVSNG